MIFEKKFLKGLKRNKWNGKNHDLEIVKNPMENPSEVKYDGEPISLKSQDILKVVDFLGIENFDFVFNPLLIYVTIISKPMRRNFMPQYIKDTSFKTESRY